MAPIKGSMEKKDYKHCHDLAELEEITLENVLQCLLERYSVSKYYTYAGSMLISMNPCLHGTRKPFDNLLEVRKFEQDKHKELESNGDTSETSLQKRKDPHIFCIAEKCLKSLKTVGNNQVIIVSGDSGAGKTTAIQQLLQYFINKNEKLRQMQTPNGLDKRICFATSILESLGNASTTANPNSSRFGRFVQLNYESGNGSIIGASIRTCLLEKHRVSKCSPNERNFHIFYYVLFGLENGIFHISDFVDNTDLISDQEQNNWKNLIPKYFLDAMKSTDDEDFLSLYQSLQCLKLLTELNRVFRVIFGLMVLLNIRFVRDIDGSDDEDDMNGSIQKEFTVENKKVVEIVGDIFGMDPHEIIDALVSRKIVAGGPRRKSIFRKPCESVTECDERLAAFTNSLYDGVFNYVLAKVNSMLCISSSRYRKALQEPQTQDFFYSSEDSNEVRTLSLLDLYGFENLELNHLEQLCINYANERLHNVYLQNLKTCRDELTNSDLLLEQIPQLELDRIEKESLECIECFHTILFRTLNEECLLNRSPVDTEVFDRLTIASLENKYLVRRGKLYDQACPFIVKHYASDVQYQLKGMVRKNLDYIPPEFSQLLQTSQSICIQCLIPHLSQSESINSSSRVEQKFGKKLTTPETTPRVLNKNREKTVLQRFKTSVDSLVAELLSNEKGQEIHFIKCIRPSHDIINPGGKIQANIVKQQLYSSGIVDAVKIVGNGFPIRIMKSKFNRIFHPMLQRCIPKSSILENANCVFSFLGEIFGFTNAELRLGSSQIFMTESTWIFFTGLNDLILNHSARSLQSFFEERIRKKKEQERLAELAFRLASIKAQVVLQRETEVSNDKFETNEKGRTKSGLAVSIGPDGDCNGIENITAETLPIKVKVQDIMVPRSSKLLQARSRNSFPEVIRELKPIFQKLNLGVENGLVTKGQVYHGPVSFFTRQPALPFAQVVPRYLQSQGIYELVSCSRTF